MGKLVSLVFSTGVLCKNSIGTNTHTVAFGKRKHNKHTHTHKITCSRVLQAIKLSTKRHHSYLTYRVSGRGSGDQPNSNP